MFDWTNYSNLTRLQINVHIILFSNRQFDSFFHTTPTCITPSLTDHIALPTSKGNFCSKILENFSHFRRVVSLPFLQNTRQQHYFTKNRKKEKTSLTRWKSDLIKCTLLTSRSLQRTFEQFSYFLPLKYRTKMNVIK